MYTLQRFKELENVSFDNVLIVLFLILGVPETPKTGTGISSSGRDAGMVAGVVVAVISGIIILGALVSNPELSRNYWEEAIVIEAER